MKPLLLTCIFVCYALFANAQFYAMGDVGYGTYRMTDMKEFQKEISQSSGIALKSISNFPGYVNYGLGVGYDLTENQSIGATYRYMSTGARSDYADYSGRARVDNLIHCHTFGTFVTWQLNSSRVWPLSIFVNTLLAFTNSDVSTYMEVYDQASSSDRITLKGSSVAVMAALSLQRNLPYGLFVFTRAGYELHAGGTMFYGDTETDLKAQWSGVRLSIGAGINISRANAIEE